MQTIVYPKTAPLPISLRPTSTSLFTLIQQKSSINELATAEVFRFFWKYKQRLFQSRRYFATTLIWRHGNSKKSARSGNSDCPSRNYGVERLSNGSFLLGSQNLGAVLGSQKDSQSAKKKHTQNYAFINKHVRYCKAVVLIVLWHHSPREVFYSLHNACVSSEGVV